MKKNVVILIAEDDLGHAALVRKNLRRAGISNEIIHFTGGQETLDFLFRLNGGLKRKEKTPYILLLDIRMPKIDGTEVLRQIKKDEELKKIPVIVLTTTDDPVEIDLCHHLGCSVYMTKPVEHDDFGNAIQRLGAFLSAVEVPDINGCC